MHLQVFFIPENAFTAGTALQTMLGELTGLLRDPLAGGEGAHCLFCRNSSHFRALCIWSQFSVLLSSVCPYNFWLRLCAL